MILSLLKIEIKHNKHNKLTLRMLSGFLIPGNLVLGQAMALGLYADVMSKEKSIFEVSVPIHALQTLWYYHGVSRLLADV